MRTAWVLLLLVACGPKTSGTTTSAAPQGPPLPIECPSGSKGAGQLPPEGKEIWCQLVDAGGNVFRQGPAIEYYPDGVKAAVGSYDRNYKQGYWQAWYPDGQPKSQGSYEHGVPVGVWAEFHQSGSKSSEGGYAGGQPDGTWTYWHPNGQIRTQGVMVAGQPDGTWIEYDENGRPTVEREYRGGRQITHRGL